jgi:hypothetical protein
MRNVIPRSKTCGKTRLRNSNSRSWHQSQQLLNMLASQLSVAILRPTAKPRAPELTLIG